jgi:hypothetical protein
MPENKRVAVCIPSGGTWLAPMAFQALCLAIHSSPHVHLMPMILSGDDTAQARNRLVRMAQRHGAAWILWMDADMVFPPDALLRLMKHNRAIVGVDYRKRAAPYDKVSVSLSEEETSLDPPPGLVEKAIIGLGLVLVKMSVFESLPAPWFGRSWMREYASMSNPDGFSTEDAYFCNVARQKGYRVWCDRELSREIQHVGEMAVPFELPARPEIVQTVASS